MKLVRTASGTKFRLNKFDWLKIGLSSNWLSKTSKVATINGETYRTEEIYFDKEKQQDYILEDIEEDGLSYIFDVTYDNGQRGSIIKRQAPKSIASPKYNLIFTEGKTQWNNKGNYKILKILSPEDIEVEYVGGSNDGEKQVLNIVDQEKIIHNEEVRKDKENLITQTISFKSPSEYFTLGYMAANGTVVVNINENAENMFDDAYRSLTSDDANKYKDGKGYSTRKPYKGGDWYKIIFPTPGAQVANKMSFSGADVVNDGDNMQINSKNYIMNLFKMGFHIGRNKDNVGSIIARIGNEDNRSDFILGSSYKGENVSVESSFSLFDLIIPLPN